jgi:hypothetical protein
MLEVEVVLLTQTQAEQAEQVVEEQVDVLVNQVNQEQLTQVEVVVQPQDNVL